MQSVVDLSSSKSNHINAAECFDNGANIDKFQMILSMAECARRITKIQLRESRRKVEMDGPPTNVNLFQHNPLTTSLALFRDLTLED